MQKNYSKNLKAKVVLAAMKEDKTLAELSSIFEVPAKSISKWRKQAKENMASLFETNKKSEEREKDKIIEKLYREYGKLQIEHDWLKKKLIN